MQVALLGITGDLWTLRERQEPMVQQGDTRES